MRILLLTQKLPLPLEDGYNLRTYHYVRRLAGRHEIHLLSLERGAMPDDLEGAFASVERHPVRPVPPPRGSLRRLVDALSPEHLHDFDPQLMLRLERSVARHEPDVVWVMGAKMLVYTARLRDVAIFADAIDEAAREARLGLGRDAPRALARGLKTWLVTRRYERRYYPHATLCNFVSEVDAEDAAALCPGLAVSVVHNGVDAEYYTPGDEPPDHPSLVFEGRMRHAPNAQGVVHFCREVLPRIRDAVPGTRLWIVGKDPGPEVRALAGSGVEVTGFVDDVRPWVRRASLFVSPLVGGTGIKNKILQAWAMEKPVVGTPVSCGGLRVAPDENIRVAPPGPDFARACVELLGDAGRRAALGRAGRRTVLDHYTWDAKADEIEALLGRAAARARARAALAAMPSPEPSV